MLKVCYKKSGVDRNELIELEMTKNLDHLPNSHALKVFIRCAGELTEAVDPKSNRILLTKFSEYFADLTKEEQEIYLGMTKGCIKKAKQEKDLLEFTYVAFVCTKLNDNEVKRMIEP